MYYKYLPCACNLVLTSAKGYEHICPKVLLILPHARSVQKLGCSPLEWDLKYFFFNVSYTAKSIPAYGIIPVKAIIDWNKKWDYVLIDMIQNPILLLPRISKKVDIVSVIICFYSYLIFL